MGRIYVTKVTQKRFCLTLVREVSITQRGLTKFMFLIQEKQYYGISNVNVGAGEMPEYMLPQMCY